MAFSLSISLSDAINGNVASSAFSEFFRRFPEYRETMEQTYSDESVSSYRNIGAASIHGLEMLAADHNWTDVPKKQLGPVKMEHKYYYY